MPPPPKPAKPAKPGKQRDARQRDSRPPIAALKDVRLQDGTTALFDGVDLAIDARVRACLVGRNGAGKSTLMKVIAGRIEPDGGARFVQPGLTTAFVPQEPEIVGATVLDHATSGGAAPYEAEAMLTIFGLAPGKSTTGLSGGEIRRAALAKAFAEGPDLLLLDEPTNHLDIAAIETLEAELLRSRAAALIVSHDRAFLQRVTRRCFWLAHRKVRTLDEGFTAFEPWAAKMEAEEAETLRRLEKAIERETYTFYRSITAQRTRNEGRARALEDMRLRKAAILKDQTRALDMQIDAGGTSGKLVAEVKGISKSFATLPHPALRATFPTRGKEEGARTSSPFMGEGDHAEHGGGGAPPREILRPFSTRILRGDRVAIVGPNGAGKTTLVKLLLGEIPPDEGSVKLGSGLQTVYLDQSRDELRGDDTLWDALTPGGGDSILVRGQSRHVAAYARDFLFKESQLRQPVSSLSGGERNRLLLARALAKPANLLVLDEPTNDLDMETLSLLEDLLADYEGTLILVSHDRDFIDRLATSTIALDGRGNAVETPGGWSDFHAQNPGFFDEGPVSSPTAKASPAAPPRNEAPPPARAGKLSYKDQRRLDETVRQMGELPLEIARLETALHDPDLYRRNPQQFDRLTTALTTTRQTLAAAEEDWLMIEEARSGG